MLTHSLNMLSYYPVQFRALLLEGHRPEGDSALVEGCDKTNNSALKNRYYYVYYAEKNVI